MSKLENLIKQALAVGNVTDVVNGLEASFAKCWDQVLGQSSFGIV
jgi:hypothetical protein